MILTPQLLARKSTPIPSDAMHALFKRERRAKLDAFAARFFRLDHRVEASHLEAARDAREARLALSGVCVFDLLNAEYGSEVVR